MSKSKKMTQYERMTSEAMPKLILSMGIPAVVSLLISTVYNMVDTWFVSHLGTEAVAAVGVTLSVTEAISAIGYFFGMGSGTCIGMLLGAKNKNEAARYGSTSFFTSVMIGITFAALGLLFQSPMMRFLGASEAVLPYAISYSRWILIGFPVMASSLVLSTILRCEGRMQYSMMGIGLGGVLNMALDPLFIFTFGLGVAGAAVATFVSQSIGLAILLSFYLRGKTETKLAISHFRPDLKMYGKIFSTGLPSFCRHGTMTVATIALNTVAGAWGGDVLIAALSIVNKVNLVIQAVVKGIFQGAQASFSYNKGAGNYKRVREAYSFTLTFTSVLMVVIAFVMLFAARGVMSLFGSVGEEVIRVGAWAMIVQTFALLLMPFNFSGNTLLQSVGEPFKSTVLTLLPQGLFYVPLLFLLPLVFKWQGVVYAFAAGQILTAMVTLPIVRIYFKNVIGK